MFRKYFLPYLTWVVYSLLARTWRYTFHEPKLLIKKLAAKEPVVFAHWHGAELAIVPLVKKYRLSTMTSTSKDGVLIDYVIKKYGGQTSKGSSTRGSVSALKGLIRLCKNGFNASIAVDGPKGPIYKVKPGVFQVSRLLQAPIIPVGVFVHNGFTFRKSWNQAIIPFPFSRVSVYFEEPYSPAPKKDSCKCSQIAVQLAQKINDASSHSQGT